MYGTFYKKGLEEMNFVLTYYYVVMYGEIVDLQSIFLQHIEKRKKEIKLKQTNIQLTKWKI